MTGVRFNNGGMGRDGKLTRGLFFRVLVVTVGNFLIRTALVGRNDVVVNALVEFLHSVISRGVNNTVLFGCIKRISNCIP